MNGIHVDERSSTDIVTIDNNYHSSSKSREAHDVSAQSDELADSAKDCEEGKHLLNHVSLGAGIEPKAVASHLQKATLNDITARRSSGPLAVSAYSYTANTLGGRGNPRTEDWTPITAEAESPNPLSRERDKVASASPVDTSDMPAEDEDEDEPTIGGFSITQMLKDIDVSKKGATTLADVEETLRKYAAMAKARKS